MKDETSLAACFGTISLGELIDRLKKHSATAHVFLDVFHLRPTGLHSYRGYYDHLAIGWRQDDAYTTVQDLLKLLESAIGGTFHGWKGGEYRMSRETPVWIDQAGDASGVTICGVDGDEDSTLIHLQTGRASS